jgi:hypothetical protein
MCRRLSAAPRPCWEAGDTATDEIRDNSPQPRQQMVGAGGGASEGRDKEARWQRSLEAWERE